MKPGYYGAGIFFVSWVLSAFSPVRAVIFYATSDAAHNTSAPTGSLADSGWNLQGDSLPGIPVAPNFFITASHLEAKIGDTFSFRGVSYPMVAAFPHPDADITVWQVNGTFPEYAALYTRSDEVDKPLVVFGRGSQRGAEVWHNDELKGWLWGDLDGLLRWGENVVAGISDPDGKPATSATRFQLLRADFDANGSPNEAHLSGGDSGGGLFIHDGEGWKLAGVNHAANRDYSPAAGEASIKATLFDESGFIEGEAGEEEVHPEAPELTPGSFFATRLSAYSEWIQSVLHAANASLTLEQATNLLGPYAPVPDAILDLAARTITILEPDATHFYRIIGDRSYNITGMVQADGNVQFSYE